MSERHIVVGGGLLGLATAQALAERGEPVTLLEGGRDLGCGASFANGGLLHPSMPNPWNAPGVGALLPAALFDPSSSLRVDLHRLPGLASWGWRFLRNAEPGRYALATKANYRLAAYSAQLTEAWRRRGTFAYDADDCGSLKLLRTEASAAAPLAVARMLEPLGLRYRLLSAAETAAVEPQLAAVQGQIFGALRFEDDRTGDAHAFCLGLADEIRRLGGEIRTGRPVRRLLVAAGRVVGVATDHETLSARTVSVAAGSWSPRLLGAVGVRLPVAPVKGCSLTFTAPEGSPMPRIPVIDAARNIAVTPLGRRYRVVGSATFGGHGLAIGRRVTDQLKAMFAAVYPRQAAAIDLDGGAAWAGLRPVSADGRPFIGRTTVEGLFVNTGHGHLGWTTALGSGAVAADFVCGRRPEIDATPFDPLRVQ